MQGSNNFAWLLVDTLNVTLVSDVAVSSNPLRVLEPSVPFAGDASSCLLLTSPLAGAPSQCDQFFRFDFSTNAPPSSTGYSWGFTIVSKNGNPLPFSSAIVAAGASCPSHDAGSEDSWFDVPLDPRAPGNSPTQLTVSSLAIGTAHQKWWIQLKVDQKAGATTPFAITASYDVVRPPQPSTTTTPSSSPQSTPPTTQNQPQQEGSPTTQQRQRKPVPIWAIAIISVACVLLAAGALFWAWRLSKQKPSQTSYEIY